jgi:hypothetical protein
LFGIRLLLPPAFNAFVYLGLLALALLLRERSVGSGIVFLVLPHKFYGGKKFEGDPQSMMISQTKP